MAFVVLKTKTGWCLRHDRSQGGRRLQRRIPIKDYSSIGFSEHMTIEQARERAHQLTATASLKKQEASRQAIKDRRKASDFRVKALLPLEEEFRVLLDTERKETQWRVAREFILAIPVQLEHWGAASSHFHSAIITRRIGPDYARRILKLINSYGDFVATTHRRTFSPVKPLLGAVRGRVRAASRIQESAPLRPEALQEAKKWLDPRHYNWLYVSVWMGLRPMEIDQRCWFEVQEGHDCALVYQTKLVGLGIPPKETLKIIPCLFDEQRKAFELMKSRDLKRPYQAILEKLGTGLYGGRKGFVNLMKERGRDFLEIQHWLGHKSIDTTMRYYREKDKVVLNK